MKPLLTAIALALFLLLPAPAFSAYVIHLHDGTQFVTDQYFEDGDLIKFKRYGGLIGIEKERIREIEVQNLSNESQIHASPGWQSSAAASETTGKSVKPAPEADVPGTQKTELKQSVEGTVSTDQEEAGKPNTEQMGKRKPESDKRKQAFVDEKRRIMSEIERTKAAFKEAKANNNQAQKEKWWLERGRLRAEFSELERKVRAANEGRLPDWWQD